MKITLNTQDIKDAILNTHTDSGILQKGQAYEIEFQMKRTGDKDLEAEITPIESPDINQGPADDTAKTSEPEAKTDEQATPEEQDEDNTEGDGSSIFGQK